MELSNRVYHYEYSPETCGSTISIFKSEIKLGEYTVKYIQKKEPDRNYFKIKSKYYFKIINETETFNYDTCITTKTIIMKVSTNQFVRPEIIYKLYNSDNTVKTIEFKCNGSVNWYRCNGSFSNDSQYKCVIFKYIDNELSIPSNIGNIIFYYEEEKNIWIGSRDGKIYTIEIKE